LKAPGTNLLTLKYGMRLLNFVFTFILRRYIKAAEAAAAEAAQTAKGYEARTKAAEAAHTAAAAAARRTQCLAVDKVGRCKLNR
jgi:hypothetical protein